ncbi:MAG TPA: tRNA adenosine(34) deaminase TadA [Abditibacteriaceae bacterium]|jgi:tRNA(adenine34) deaminase
MQLNDEFWMRQAIVQAQKCMVQTRQLSIVNPPSEDVPIGALCIYENRIIGCGHNRREANNDPTAHAEIIALREAAHALGQWRLTGVTLYVTLEPCPMCAGAIWLSRIERLVFGAWELKSGACGSIFDIPRDPRLNHRPQVKGGVLEKECAALLEEFFALRRL